MEVHTHAHISNIGNSLIAFLPLFSTLAKMASVDELKDAGNKAFQAGDFQKAIEIYGKAIALDSFNHVLFSNRSVAFASLKNYQAAHADATKTVLQHPSQVHQPTLKNSL